jgi:glutamyl-tRNA synthetase
VKLSLHPEQPDRGFREYTITPAGEDKAVFFWVEKKDAENAQGAKVVRLMELFNVKLEEAKAYCAEASYASDAYSEARKTKARLIHWILVGEDVPCQVVMPDATVNGGIAESACEKLKPNTVIQFERFGFVRVDEVAPKLTAYYGHK